MAKAADRLAEAEVSAVADSKSGKSNIEGTLHLPPGLEYEILQADATILLGLTQGLSESYLGYLNCM